MTSAPTHLYVARDSEQPQILCPLCGRPAHDYRCNAWPTGKGFPCCDSSTDGNTAGKPVPSEPVCTDISGHGSTTTDSLAPVVDAEPFAGTRFVLDFGGAV